MSGTVSGKINGTIVKSKKRFKVKCITASNTKIEKEVNEFLDSISDLNGLTIINGDIREGNNNVVASIWYSYIEK